MEQRTDHFTIMVSRLDESGEEIEVPYTRPIFAGADFELSDDEKGAIERVIDYFGSGFHREIPDGHILAHWWSEFLRGPMRNLRIGTDDFRRSRAGLIAPYDLQDMAEYVGIEVSQIGQFSVIELLEALASKASAAEEQTTQQTIEGGKNADKPQRLRGEKKRRRDDVIREFAKGNDHTQAQLATIFGLAESTINEILNPKK